METKVTNISERLNKASISLKVKTNKYMQSDSQSPSLSPTHSPIRSSPRSKVLIASTTSETYRPSSPPNEMCTGIFKQSDLNDRDSEESKLDITLPQTQSWNIEENILKDNESSLNLPCNVEGKEGELDTPPQNNKTVTESTSSNQSPGSTSGRGLVSQRGGRGRLYNIPSSRAGAFRVANDSIDSPSPSQVMRSHPENKSSLSVVTDESNKSSSDDKKRGKPPIQLKEKKTHDDAPPSLCSTLSGSLQTSSSSSSCSQHSPPKTKMMEYINNLSSNTPNKQNMRSPLHLNPQFDASAMLNHSKGVKVNSHRDFDNPSNQNQNDVGNDKRMRENQSFEHKRKPSSITVDSSCVPSPLHHDLKDRRKNKDSDFTDQKNLSNGLPKQHQSEKGLSPNQPSHLKKEIGKENPNELRQSHIVRSPLPSKENQIRDADPRRTPIFGKLAFHDARSPTGLFSSPYSPLDIIADSPSFDQSTPRITTHPILNTDQTSSSEGKANSNSSGIKSNDHVMANAARSSSPTTPRPTDSNPFSWLTSPSQAFFSPNPSESGRATNSTINTPTFSSMFFQENVKGLTPIGAGTQNDDKKGNTQIHDIQRNHPYSKMICISPLASSKKQRCKSTGDLPNYSFHKDGGRDRKQESYDDILNVPLTSPTLHFDMHIAEKDLMEDEDLSVLLQLASSSNANNSMSNSPIGQKKYSLHVPPSKVTPSSLQLPLMSGPETNNQSSNFPPKIARMTFRKSNTSNQMDQNLPNDFAPPSLQIRPNTSCNFPNRVTQPPSSNRSLHSDNTKVKNSPPTKHIKPTTKQQTGKGQAPNDSTKKTKNPSKVKPVISHDQTHHSASNYPPRNTMPMPSGNYQYPNVPGPHPHNMHPPPVSGGHDANVRPVMNSNIGYHDGMNHSGPPIGDMRPMQHHMPPNNYAQNTNPNPHMRAHTLPSGQIPTMPSQGNMGPSPYHHYPHPPQTIHSTGQYAPYTTLNQSHSKSKITNKKGNIYGQDFHAQGNHRQRSRKGKSTPSPSTKRPGGGSDMIGSGKKKAKPTPPKAKKGSGSGKNKSSSKNLTSSTFDSGDKNAHAAALAAAILRGVTMRPSGKWQAQLYYAGKSRYIGVFDTREKAALAYEIAREKLKSGKSSDVNNQCIQDTDAAVSMARKAAFEGVNEPDPRPPHKR